MKKTILFMLIAALLLMGTAGCKKAAAPEPEPTAAPEPAPTAAPGEKAAETSFTVFCRLADGTPVPGATVQVCTGSLCQMLTADDQGLIVYYTMPGKTYDVTPVRAPGCTLVSDKAVIANNGDRIEFVFEKN